MIHKVAAAIILVSLVGGWQSQSGGQQRPAPFAARVDLVQLDVSVLDARHQPVLGLSQRDFTVKENGKAQPVQTFVPVNVVASSGSAAPAWMRSTPSDVFNNSAVDGRRLVVLVMDDAAPDIVRDMAAIRSAKAIGAGVIDQLGDDDLAAVVHTAATAHNQEFTHDRARLRASVEKFNPATGFGDPTTTLELVQHVAEVLGTVPERRKAVIWITPGSLGSALTWRDMLTAARRANVNIYPVDPGGLRVPEIDSLRGNDLLTSPTEFNRTAANDHVRALRDFLFTTAANTGGHAFTNWNEFKSSVAQIFRETGSFYLLGYVSSHTAVDGKFRRLEVSVNRPGVKVHTRAGYFGQDPKSVDRATPAEPVVAAVAGLLPSRGLSLRLAAAPFRALNAPVVAVTLGVSTAGRVADDLDIVIAAFTLDGKEAASERLRAVVQPSTSGNNEHELHWQFALEPGRYQVRAGVTSAQRGVSASVYGDLDVPTFDRELVSMSTIVFGHEPSLGALASLVPIRPATTRLFTPQDPWEAYSKVYLSMDRPAQRVVVNAAIIDARDARVYSSSASIDSERFHAELRTADYRLALPLSTLMAGEYLLRLEALLDGGVPVSRSARFTVR